jgi:hypothetical protein
VAVEVRRQHGELVSERGRDSNGGRILSGMCCPLLCSPATARLPAFYLARVVLEPKL